MRSVRLLTTALLASHTVAAKASSGKAAHHRDEVDDNDTPLPLLFWHGLGDAFDQEGIQNVGELADAIHPGTFFYPIALAENGNADRQATFMGNVTEQLESVCEAIASHPILSTAPAVDAIGFSQGGQFMRGYVERCNSPPVRSLVTFGSQHNGITKFKPCGPTEWMCKTATAILRYNMFSDFVQRTLVPAQYFRDPEDYDTYLEHSNYLADINNERPVKNPLYKENIQRLSNFVMYMFDKDSMVVPKESSLFAEVDEETGVTPLQKTKAYEEDWLGLKELDRKGGLRFRKIDGDHMQIDEAVMRQAMIDFFGPLGRTFTPESKTEPQQTVSSEEL